MPNSISQVKVGGGIAAGGLLVAGGAAAGVALIGAGSALLALPIVGIVTGAALIALGAYLYWKAGASNPPPLSARPAQIIVSIKEPKREASPESSTWKTPWIAAAPIAAAALLSYAYLGPKENGLPNAGGSQDPIPTLPIQLPIDETICSIDPPRDWGSCPRNMSLLIQALGDKTPPLPKLETLLQQRIRVRSIWKKPERQPLPLLLTTPGDKVSPLSKFETLLQQPNLFTSIRKKPARKLLPLFLPAPPQIRPKINDSPMPTPLSGGIIRAVSGADFLAPDAKRSDFSIWTAAAAAAALAASSIAYLKSGANEIRKTGERLFGMKRPPPWPQTGRGSPFPVTFGSGSGSVVAPLSREINLGLPSLIPQQELEPGLQEVLEESLRAAGTWVPVDEFVQEVRNHRLDPEPFLRHCERRGNLINVAQIDQTPLDEMRLTIDDKALLAQLLREDEEMEAQAEKEDFQRRMDAVRNREAETQPQMAVSEAGASQGWDSLDSYITHLRNYDDEAIRRQLQEVDDLEEQAYEEDLQRAMESWRAEQRRVNRRIESIVSHIQPPAMIRARM